MTRAAHGPGRVAWKAATLRVSPASTMRSGSHSVARVTSPRPTASKCRPRWSWIWRW
jgi:hypothetical protein